MSRNNKSSFLRQNAQEHYKMYKRGKNWVYAGIFTFAISLGVGLSTQNAEASDTTPVSTDTSVVTSAANSNTASVALNSHSTNNLSEANNAASNFSVDNASETVAATSTSTSQTESSVASEAIVSEPANQTDTSSASKSDRAVSAQRTSVDANQASSSADIQTLNNPTSDQIQEAKSAAEEQYQQTGQPQQINAIAADTATSGTVSTGGQWQISDGTLQIAGDISGLTTPAPWSGNTDITSIDFVSNSTILPADSSNLFANLPSLTTVSDINNIDFTNITSMKNMFANDTALTNITFATSVGGANLTDVSGMFENDTSLQTVDVSGMNIETVTTAADMFRNDTSLTSVNAQWGVGNSMQDISGMFENTPQLTTLNISGWQMTNLTTAANFLNNLTADNQAGNSQLATIDTSQWVSDVFTDLSGAFAGNSGLTDLNLGQIGTSHVTTMANMFYQDSSLSEVDNYPKWDVSNVTDFDNLFNGTAFTTLNFEAWTPNASATMNQMLDNNSHLINITFGADMPAMNLANINVNNPTWAAVGFGTGDVNGGGVGQTVTNPSGAIVTSYDGVTPDTYVLANTATITYLDADNGDQPIAGPQGTQVISGAVSPDASYAANYLMQLPTGYTLADSTQNRLGTDVIKLGDDDSDDFTVELKHIIDTETDDWTLQIGYINDTIGKGSTTSMGVTTVYSPNVIWTIAYDEVTKITTYTPSIDSATLTLNNFPVGYSPDIAAYPNGGFADSATDPLGATYDASTQTVDFTPVLQSQSVSDGTDPLDIGRGAYTVTIHVTADPQQAQVIFEDEDNNNAQVGAGIPINGVTNESTTYNVSQQIPTGYELADAFQPVSGNYSFTIPTSATEVPTWVPKIVLLKHVHDSGTTTTTNTVTYTGLPNNLTPADNVTSVNWNVDLDQANNDETFTPTSTGNTVTSPVIPGYTASQTTVTFTNDPLGPSDGAVNKADVPQNQKITVTYTADQQNATVTYIDDDENSTIQTDKLTGGSNTTSDYDYTGTLKGFTDEGYELVSTDVPASIVFDSDDNADQAYTVHLKHVHDVNQAAITTNNVVTYTGTPTDLTPADSTNPVTWSSDTDEVTGTVVYTPSDQSETVPTPPVTGYTPDQDEVTFTNTPITATKEQTTTPQDQQQTVIYTADTQKAVVEYVDGNGNKILADQPISGGTGSLVEHDQIVPNIQEAINQGYNLVTDGTLNAQFDNDDNTDQVFKVVLTPVPVIKTTTPIKPELPNGNDVPGEPTTPVTETGIPDTPIDTTMYPNIPGYTVVPGQPVPNFPEKTNTPTIVIYAPDTQKAVVEYIDETTGDTIIPNQSISGDTSTQVDHTQVVPGIQEAINQGYNLVTDGTLNAYFDNDDNTDQVFKVVLTPVAPIEITTPLVPEGPNGEPLTPTEPKTVTGIPGEPVGEKDWPDVPGYTPNPGQDPKIPDTPNTPTVINYTPDTQKAVVEYVDENGNKIIADQPIEGKTDEQVDHSQVVPGIQEAINQGYNLVTDGTLNAYFDNDDNTDQVFKVVLTPVVPIEITTPLVPEGPNGEPLTPTEPKTVTGIPGEPVGEKDWPDVPGYTPNPGQDPKIPDTPNTPTVINYTPDTQKAVVEYVDENGNKIIADQPIEGKTDEQVDHTQVVPGIQEAINQGYNLVTDGTLNAYFDNDDNTDQVFKVVLTPVTPIEITTPLVPEGPNGEPLTPTEPKTVTGIPGEPVGEKDWPDVPGYTPNPGQDPKIPDTPNTPTVINYTPDTQKAVVEYVDENGNKIIADQPIEGKTDEQVDHTQVVPGIQEAINQGYNLVTDGTLNAYFDNDDNTDQVFKVVLTPVTPIEITTPLVPEGPNGEPLTPTEPKTVTGIPGEPVGEKDWPDVPGYTPNPGQDPKIPDTPNTPTVINYTPDTQKAVVEYVDENGNKIIADQPIEGKTDEQVDHTQVVPGIQEAINQGYNLVTDGTLNAYFDNDDNTDQVFKVVLTPVTPIEITTPLVPEGPNGEPLTPTEPKTVTGIPGEPVGEKDWPDVPGYTPNPGQDPKIPDTPNTPTVINYTPDTQKAVVEYVDENGNKIIADQPIEGKTDEQVDHTQVVPGIQEAINQGYNLVTDGTLNAYFDNDDNTDQVFKVVLTPVVPIEITTPVTPVGPDGNPIPGITPKTVTGIPGQPITSKDWPDVPGYTVEPGQNPKIPNTPNTPTDLVYVPNTPTESTTPSTPTPENDTPNDQTPNQPEQPTAVKENTPTPVSETQPGTPVQPIASTPQSSQVVNHRVDQPTSVAESNNGKLPQTGDEQNSLLASIGLAMFSALSMFGLAGRKRRHD